MIRINSNLIIAVMALILLSCAPGPKLTVWHAWDGKDVEELQRFTVEYEKANDLEIDLKAFETHQALLDKLLGSSERPDVFFGFHRWGSGLLERGIVSAYCFPEQCPECFEPNPPDWCKLANGDFGYRLTGDFLMGPEYCLPDQCDECRRPNPPPWCPFVRDGLNIRIDVIHAAMIDVYRDTDVFPHGIPIWWEYVGVFVNPDWFEENNVEIPTNIDQVSQVVGEFGVYLEKDFFRRTGLQVPSFAEGNPSPEPSLVGVIVGSSDSFSRLQEQVNRLKLLKLEDYRPEILVHGVYLNKTTQLKGQALDFMYQFTNEENQNSLFKMTGHFPGNGLALSRVGDGVMKELVQFGKKGLLALPSLQPPPDVTEK